MKKALLVIILIICTTALFAVSYSKKDNQVNLFDSVPMLENHYGKNIQSNPALWDEVKVSLITISKDDPVYAWFGHTGILVEGLEIGSVLYDYGRFEFGKDFYYNFAMGKLWYKCMCVNANTEFDYASLAHRTVIKTELNLTPEQKLYIVQFLNLNADEQYNTYLYHHYKDNCATRIRDIINKATDGRFEYWAKSIPGYTYRQQTSRMLYNSIPIQWLFETLQSGYIDQKCTLWDEMFLPQNLEKAVNEFENLAKEKTYITDFRETDTRAHDYDKPKSNFVISLCVGLIFALFAALSYELVPFLYKVECFVINLSLGLIGTVLLFMMTCTAHDFTFFNENILFINPLLIWIAIVSLRYQKHKKLLKIFYCVSCCIVACLMILKIGIPTVFYQNNFSQIATVLPFFVANALIYIRS